MFCKGASGCCELVVVWKAEDLVLPEADFFVRVPIGVPRRCGCRRVWVCFSRRMWADMFGFGRISFSGVADIASFVHCFLSMSVVQHICGVGFV